MNILFFGSTTDSVLVVSKLEGVIGVVTQPPKPVGRTHVRTPTPVEIWAKEQNIPVHSFPADKDKKWLFENESDVVDRLKTLNFDTLMSASFGQKIPADLIKTANNTYNVHPSLLPRWRGADPVPWAILSGDTQTGVTVQSISQDFDKGKILAQKKVPITDTDTSDALRTKLFTLGADLLLSVIQNPNQQCINVSMQQPSYARRFTREDGFISWEKLLGAMNGVDASKIDRMFRALHPWPGIWTTFRDKRIKILSCSYQPQTMNLEIHTVQLEGKQPVSFSQFKTAYLS